jgi:hypothetical protein
MEVKPVAKFGPFDINKFYLVYDRYEGWHTARPYQVKNLMGEIICMHWELHYTDSLLVDVTHVAELPPNPLA